MISWIQKYFQQHFRTIFAVLLAVTIISFIFTIGASPGIGRADRKVSSQNFFGHNLASDSEKAQIEQETQLSNMLNREYADPSIRLTGVALADQLHIPGPTESEFKEYLKSLRGFTNEKGEFDPAIYKQFQTSIGKMFPEALVRKVLEDDFRITRVALLLGGPGYVQSHEIKTVLERLDTSWTLGIASVDYKSFNPTITPTEADLTKFFTEHTAHYTIPPQVSVRYADFSAPNYLDKVTVTEAELKAYYDANPARFSPPSPAKPDDKKPATPASFETARLQVELALKMERASRLAAKAASDLTVELYDKKITPGSFAFAELLADRKITLKDVAPFSHEEPPAELGRNPDVADEAFKLSKDRPCSDAIALNAGAVVLFWQQNIPARQPEFAEVKAKVSTDYVELEKQKRFAELGKTLHNQIEARIKAGDTFDKAIATVGANASAKIEGKTLAPFTLRQRPQDIDPYALNALETLQKGAVSDMIANSDKGLIVYAADKKAPDLTEANPMYKTMQFQLSRSMAMRNSAEYLRSIAEAEMAKNTTPAQQ